jgi:hypothetical protein
MFLAGMELIIANATRIPASDVCLRVQIVVKESSSVRDSQANQWGITISMLQA